MVYTITATSTTSVVSTSSSTQRGSDDDSSLVGIIAGCVIGVVFCITLVIIMLWYISRRKGKVEVLQDESKCYS